MNGLPHLGTFLEGHFWKNHFEKFALARIEEEKAWRQRARLICGQWQVDFSSRSVFTSVTHTFQGHQGALWVLACDRPVGIDLEFASRKLSSRLTSRLLRSEKSWDLAPLAFWVIKEAAFKANPCNRGTVLSQYRVISWNPATSRGRVQFQEEGGNFHLFYSHECWMACVLWSDFLF
jgi:hypothetical protein